MTEQKDDLEDRKKDLTLLLAYLTSWEEKVLPDRGVRRAWKGYDFDVLNQLEAEAFSAKAKAPSLFTLRKKGNCGRRSFWPNTESPRTAKEPKHDDGI